MAAVCVNVSAKLPLVVKLLARVKLPAMSIVLAALLTSSVNVLSAVNAVLLVEAIIKSKAAAVSRNDSVATLLRIGAVRVLLVNVSAFARVASVPVRDGRVMTEELPPTKFNAIFPVSVFPVIV